MPIYEIFGDLPEVFLLPKCQKCADNCKSPLTHSLKKLTNKTRILALLNRLHTKLKPLRITVIIDIDFEKQECVKWLTEEFSQFTCLDFLSSEIKVKNPNPLCISKPVELDVKGADEAFYVKVIEECRGMEFPALVTISYGGYSGISSTSPLIIDSWTRVTSYLCIIHVDDGFSKAFKNGLEDTLKNNVAKKVEEQDMMIGDFKKKYSNYPKEKAWNDIDRLNPELDALITTLDLKDIDTIGNNWRCGKHKLQQIICHSNGVYCLQFDDEKIVSGHRDNTIKMWDINSLACLKILKGHTGSVLHLQYDERVIISGSSDSTVRVWDVVTGDHITTLTHHQEGVHHLK